MAKKKIGFYIMGIGNGHITQAKIVYSILEKHYDIPITIFVSGNEKKEFREIFPNSNYLHYKIFADEGDMDKLNTIKSKFKSLLSYAKPYNLNEIIKIFNLDLLIGFWCIGFNDILTQKLIKPYLCIAPQYSVDNKNINLIANLSKKQVIPISIDDNNKYSDHKLPPLIDIKEIKKEKSEKNIVLAYAVNGIDFMNTLNQIAIKNEDYEFHFFYRKAPNYNFNKNVFYHKTSRIEFKEYFKIAKCVLCTSGNELIYECVYNKIPVATMASNKNQFEQVHNQNKFINKFKYAIKMDKNLDIDELTKIDVITSNLDLKKKIDNREYQVLNLIKKFI